MKKILLLTMSSVLLMTGCSSEPSLQKYFVEKSEKTNFVTVDIAPSILKIDNSKLTEEQKTSIASLKKMNILAFNPKSIDTVAFQAESKKVKEILKNKEYQELMKFNTGNGAASVYFVGEDDKIDEFVVYGSEKENRFAVIRILGKNMNPAQFLTILEVIQKADIDQSQLLPLEALLKKQ